MNASGSNASAMFGSAGANSRYSNTASTKPVAFATSLIGRFRSLMPARERSKKATYTTPMSFTASYHSSRRSSRDCLEEGGITLFEPIPIGLESCFAREIDRSVVHALEAVQQHRSVLFIEDRLADFDGIARAAGQPEPAEAVSAELS